MSVNPVKIVPCIAFDNQAEAAVNYYISIFKDSKILNVTCCGKNEPGGAEGSVRTISFKLFGQNFLAVNGGPHFKINDGISFIVNCETQIEIDSIWEKLTEGGKEIQCGWLEDKYGVSWQVVPTIIEEMLCDPNSEKIENVMKEIISSVKPNIEKLKIAFGK